MTPEMAFECVLMSSDSDILRTINRTLIDLSIATRICFHTSQAQRAIAEGSMDLLVIDLVDESSFEFLREIWKSGLKQKPTIVGISSSDHSIPGVHVKLGKPVTADSSLQSLKEAYSRMLVDFRHHTRCALMSSVTAMDDCHRVIPVTVMDIGYGGVGLRVRQELQIGQVLSIPLLLPGTKRALHLEIRVLWTRDFGRTGCEFVRVPPVDLNILHDWLKQKITVKQPAVLV
jgi:hypothetical protein